MPKKDKLTKKQRQKLGLPSRGALRRQAQKARRAQEETVQAKAFKKAVYTNGLGKQFEDAMSSQGCFGFVTKDGTLHFSADDMEAPGVQEELDRLSRIRDMVKKNPPAKEAKGKVALA